MSFTDDVQTNPFSRTAHLSESVNTCLKGGPKVFSQKTAWAVKDWNEAIVLLKLVTIH